MHLFHLTLAPAAIFAEVSDLPEITGRVGKGFLVLRFQAFVFISYQPGPCRRKDLNVDLVPMSGCFWDCVPGSLLRKYQQCKFSPKLHVGSLGLSSLASHASLVGGAMGRAGKVNKGSVPCMSDVLANLVGQNAPPSFPSFLSPPSTSASFCLLFCLPFSSFAGPFSSPFSYSITFQLFFPPLSSLSLPLCFLPLSLPFLSPHFLLLLLLFLLGTNCS